jgi:hypothetical protein
MEMHSRQSLNEIHGISAPPRRQPRWGSLMRKSLITISFLLPLAALSGTAQAGSTISDKSYWPSEARPTIKQTIPSEDRARSAFAYDRGTSTRPPETNVNATNSAWRYQGGPKSH